ncbi:MAG: hypothetical protein HZB92_04605 [Euryarchaeota archaeon]|nr:hypothetical protein [Euryarchaeota archaeon]
MDGDINTILTIFSLALSIIALTIILHEKWAWKHRFTVQYRPDPQEVVRWPQSSDYCIDVEFRCVKSNAVVYRIWQQRGWFIGGAQLSVLESKTKEPIQIGENDYHFFLVQENVPKIITLVFRKSDTRTEGTVGFQIETSDGIFKKEFNLIWVPDKVEPNEKRIQKCQFN